MTRILPPPEERFDPVTARWLTPGGPLHDPQRDSLDPKHAQPLELVEPIPRELQEVTASTVSGRDSAGARDRQRRWMLIGLVGLFVASMVIGGLLV